MRRRVFLLSQQSFVFGTTFTVSKYLLVRFLKKIFDYPVLFLVEAFRLT